MTKTFVATMAGLRPAAKSRPAIKKLERMRDGVAYWALRTYARVLKTIGDASELAANCRRGQAR